jgi:hypothetical protein
MESAVPLDDHRAVSAKGEAYRRAHDLTVDLGELPGQLDTGPDPNATIQLHESARLAVGTLVRALVPAGAVPTVRQLDAWVTLLDELLTEAQAGVDGGARGHDRIARRVVLRTPLDRPTLVADPVGPDVRFALWCRSCGDRRPVDDHDHWRACVPPMAEALASIVKGHQVANRALGQAGTPVLDPERLWHADLARDALVLLHRLLPDVEGARLHEVRP